MRRLRRRKSRLKMKTVLRGKGFPFSGIDPVKRVQGSPVEISGELEVASTRRSGKERGGTKAVLG